MTTTEIIASVVVLYFPMLLIALWGIVTKKVYWPEAVFLVATGWSLWTAFLFDGPDGTATLPKLFFLGMAAAFGLMWWLIFTAPEKPKHFRQLLIVVIRRL